MKTKKEKFRDLNRDSDIRMVWLTIRKCSNKKQRDSLNLIPSPEIAKEIISMNCSFGFDHQLSLKRDYESLEKQLR